MRFAPFVPLLSVLLFFVNSGSCGTSHGQVFLRFIYFSNPRGLGNNGHICEGKNFLKFFTKDECDHFFDITLQSFEGRHLARKETPATDDKREIHFGGHVAGMPNPLKFRVKQMHHFHIKIRVMDEDKNSNDFVGDFVTSIVTLPVSMNGGKSKQRILKHLRSDRGLQIKFQLWGRCDRSYYGRNCDVKCEPKDSEYSGHYLCDASTGAKICKKGYKGKDCLKKDHCASNPCKNGAVCMNSISSFVCRCKEGYSGDTCSTYQRVDLCAHQPCQNGATCTEIDGSTQCECRRGFVGDRCQHDLDECFQAQPCLHNGTCHNSLGSFSCACVGGFTGARCEQPPVRVVQEKRSETEPRSQQRADVSRSTDNSARPGGPESLLWPYLVAVAAVIVAVVCLAFMVTLYRRRRFIVIKERNGETVAYTASPPAQGPAENVYISDEGSDSTFYEDIDRHLSLGASEEEEEEEDGCYSGLAPPADFANASYGGFSSSREEV